MPFGNRVGTHKNNERLYAAMLDKLPEWLMPGGVALLYTMEFTLLKNLCANGQGLRSSPKRVRRRAGCFQVCFCCASGGKAQVKELNYHCDRKCLLKLRKINFYLHKH